MNSTELTTVLDKHHKWLLGQADGRSANLTGADLGGAHLTGAHLTYAYLTGANLTGADLGGAYLGRADLTYAYLTGANLTGAHLWGANLTGANLTGADLWGADLTGADLTGAKWSVPLGEQIARLDAVREIVLAKPKRLYMRHWHSGKWTPEHTPEEERSCGSAHCIAGWLQALSPDLAIRELDAATAGVQLAPIAAPYFYDDDDRVLRWFKDREYAALAGEVA